jgi:hypothetical protein
MNEKKLQHECVKWFSQTYPEFRNTLFSVNNEASNNRHAMTLKATGVVPGVSDLIWLSDGTMVGIELKTKGSSHKYSHISQQVEWGRSIKEHGGEYYVVRSLDAFKALVSAGITRGEDIFSVRKMESILEDKKATIKF